jgi:Gram-negative bacterial TonB protein C-terminal
MKRNLWILELAVLLAAMPIGLASSSFAGDDHFVPPDVTTASDTPYPVNVVGAGLVTLSVNLDAAGHVQDIQVLRDNPPQTQSTIAAVKTWTFTPGSLNHSPAPTNLIVDAVFNPGSHQGQNIPLPQLPPTTAPNPPGFFPVEISTASYAAYPLNSVATGAVVLDVTVNKYGEPAKINVLRQVASLTAPAIAAVKSWNLNAATFNGQAIASKVIIAFVFRSPTMTP